MMITEIYNNAELPQAAYAGLIVGLTDAPSNLNALKNPVNGSGMSDKQVTEFSIHTLKQAA